MATVKEKKEEQTNTARKFTPEEQQAELAKARANLAKLDSSKSSGYVSPYQSQLDDILNKINNREPFSYDMNGDALYQQYKNQFTTLGKQAMDDTIGKASALTGGYGNSYAVTAGNQAFSAQLDRLNDVIPELYQLAYSKYQQEGQDLLNQYSLLADRDAQGYSRYRDTVADDHWNQTFEYQQDRDKVSDSQWKKTFDRGVYEYDNNLAYQKSRDAVSDSQWNKSFAYKKARDLVADDQWNKSFNYQKQRDAVSDSQWNKKYQSNLSNGTTTTSPKAYEITNDDKDRFFNYLYDEDYASAENYLNYLLANGADEDVIMSLVSYFPESYRSKWGVQDTNVPVDPKKQKYTGGGGGRQAHVLN